MSKKIILPLAAIFIVAIVFSFCCFFTGNRAGSLSSQGAPLSASESSQNSGGSNEDVLGDEVFSTPLREWQMIETEDYAFTLPPIYDQELLAIDSNDTRYFVKDEWRDAGSQGFLSVKAETVKSDGRMPQMLYVTDGKEVFDPLVADIRCGDKTFIERRIEHGGIEMEQTYVRYVEFPDKDNESLHLMTFAYTTAGYSSEEQQKSFAAKNEALKCQILSTFQVKP